MTQLLGPRATRKFGNWGLESGFTPLDFGLGGIQWSSTPAVEQMVQSHLLQVGSVDLFCAFINHEADFWIQPKRSNETFLD